MTKEQFEVLLKAKHIMDEQADAAISYLRTCNLEDAVKGHYNLYLSAYNNFNFKVSNVVLKSLVKYLPKIDNKETKALVYCIMVADCIKKEKYNQAINLYYEYKKLELNDSKLDYNFDILMLNILGENKIYSKYRKYSLALSSNPFLYEIDGYHSVIFFYNCAVVYAEARDILGLERSYQELKAIIDSNRKTEHDEKCYYIIDLMEIFVSNYKAKSKKEYDNIIESYQGFVSKYENSDEVFNLKNIEAHLPIIKTFIKQKEYDYSISRLNKMLTMNCNLKLRISIYELLCECYKATNNIKYISSLEMFNKQLLKIQKNNQENVNEGLLNSIKFHDSQKTYTEIQKQYEIDQLTGCSSRNVLYKKSIEIFEKYCKGAVIFIDLDNLKEANDIYSHSFGDQYLRIFVSGVSEILKEEQGCTLFRYGGDEFVITIAHNDTYKIERLIKKIVAKFRKPLSIYDEKIKIEFSSGIALYPQNGESFEDVLKCADNYMYEAKKNNLNYVFLKK